MPDTTPPVSPVRTTSPNNKPNNLQGAPKTSDKLIAAGTIALTQAPVMAAPLLNNLNPALNPQGAGGMAVTMIGNGVGVIVQALSAQDWFDDYKYAVWACIGLSAAICTGLYIWIIGNPELGVLNALGSMHTAASSYGPLNKLGVFSRPGDKPLPPEPTPTDASVTIEHAEQVEVRDTTNGPAVTTPTTVDNPGNADSQAPGNAR